MSDFHPQIKISKTFQDLELAKHFLLRSCRNNDIYSCNCMLLNIYLCNLHIKINIKVMKTKQNTLTSQHSSQQSQGASF